MTTEPKENFEAMASEGAGGGLVSDFVCFLRQTKKWWALPILIVLLVLGLLMILSGTAAAPFIYTLF